MTSGGATPAVRPRLRRRWRAFAVVALSILVIRVLSMTWRIRRVNPERVRELRDQGNPVVFAFWHGQILPLIHAHRNEGITVLVSEHNDGEMIARVAAAFGFPSVRGSTSRGAVRSLLALVRVLREGGDVGVTPDGPRGPAGSFAPGALLAAAKSGAPLVTIAAHVDRGWRLRTWDGFLIPKPFARISVAYGEPRTIPSIDDVDSAAAEFQQLLNDTCVRASEG